MRSKLATFILLSCIAIVRYLMLMGSVQRLMYFRLYPHMTFGLYPSQIVYAMLWIATLVLTTRFAVLVERHALLWIIVMLLPIVLGGFLSMVFIDGEKIWDAVQDAGGNMLGVTIICSVCVFPIRWRHGRRRRLAAAVSAEAEGSVWPPPPDRDVIG